MIFQSLGRLIALAAIAFESLAHTAMLANRQSDDDQSFDGSMMISDSTYRPSFL